jgi:hypothetical protein
VFKELPGKPGISQRFSPHQGPTVPAQGGRKSSKTPDSRQTTLKSGVLRVNFRQMP